MEVVIQALLVLLVVGLSLSVALRIFRALLGLF